MQSTLISLSYQLPSLARHAGLRAKRILRWAQCFSTTAPRFRKNRIFDPVRSPSELQSLLLIHTSRSVPLITLFEASWCRSCAEVAPIIKGLIEDEYVGLEQGGVGFVEVELDSPTIGDLGSQYAITSIPTLVAFNRGEPQMKTRLTSVEQLRDHAFLIRWIEEEARRASKGRAGGFWLGGGLFGS